MRLGELIQKIHYLSCGADPELEVAGICCDSRRACKQELFVAVEGTEADGNQYIPQALQRGACAVVSRQLHPGLPCIRVEDSRQALAELSAAFYGWPAEKMTMVAVTGTNGKSSVTWLLKQVLEAVTGERVGLIGTLENHTGGEILPAGRTTPQSNELHRLLAAMVSNRCRYAVMEVSSHALHQGRVAGIRFAAGAFTNLSRDHLDYHKTMEAYCRAKGMLFSQCRQGVLNCDDPWYREMAVYAPGHIGFSAEKPADLSAREIRLLPDRAEFRAVYRGAESPVTVQSPGLFSVYNGLCVLALAVSLGLPLAEAAAALALAKPVRGRAEVVPTPGRDYTVLIDYAHTPDAMEKILTTLKPLCKGRLIVLFGCGGDRDRGKRAQMGEIASRLADVTILTSDNPRFEAPGAILRDILQGIRPGAFCKVLENRAEAMEYAIDIGKKDDIIVLLGKGHETYQEIAGVRLAFDERMILQRILAEKR